MAWSPPPLPQTQPDWLTFQVWWQQVIEDIAEQFTGLENTIADIQAAMDAAQAAQADATAAALNLARITSYTSPTNVLTAADVGATATISIAAHTRVYAGATDISILAASITGLAFSTGYFVYYDDPTLSDTTPNFVATTSAQTAQVGAADGRHFVGYIMTPADGAGSTGGSGGAPPGGGGGQVLA